MWGQLHESSNLSFGIYIKALKQSQFERLCREKIEYFDFQTLVSLVFP
jgi:hypothetical protein